jgi:hypothetical protein
MKHVVFLIPSKAGPICTGGKTTIARWSGPIIIKEQVSELEVNAAARVERVAGERGDCLPFGAIRSFRVHGCKQDLHILLQTQKYNLENSIVKECP